MNKRNRKSDRPGNQEVKSDRSELKKTGS